MSAPVVGGFHEVLFPTRISYGAVGGPQFNTVVTESTGGWEQRNINWSQARGKWNVAHGLKNDTDVATLIAFYRARFGKAYGFRFKDWSDYKGLAENVGTGNGSTVDYQLRRVYVDAISQTYARNVSKPVTGTVVVYVNGVVTAATVDYTTGIITFGAAPANGAIITADFEFDVPARFDTDEMQVTIENFNISSWSQIPIVEIRI